MTAQAWCIPCAGPTNTNALGCVPCNEGRCIHCGKFSAIVLTTVDRKGIEARVCSKCWRNK
jgi:hypothetical protein